MVWGIWVMYGPAVAKVTRFIATSPPAFLHGRQMVISSIGKTTLLSMLGVSSVCLWGLKPSTHWGFHFKLFFRPSISSMRLSTILLMSYLFLWLFPFLGLGFNCSAVLWPLWGHWVFVCLFVCLSVNSGSHHLMFYLVSLFEFSSWVVVSLGGSWDFILSCFTVLLWFVNLFENLFWF